MSYTFRIRPISGTIFAIALAFAAQGCSTDTGGDDPGPYGPGTGEPGTGEPGTEKPGTEKPGTEKPGTETPTADIQVADVGNGYAMANGEGHTLYVFAKDLPGVSACAGACLESWAPFDAGAEPDISNIDDPGVFINENWLDRIEREDGSFQSTYRGYPLYTFAGDTGPAQLNGDGKGGVWFTALPDSYGLFLHNTADLGAYLTTAKGITLYIFENDTKGSDGNDPVSACAGACLDSWPALTPDAMDSVNLPSLMDPAEISVVERDDGIEQLVFRGWPLYTFGGDVLAGDANGNGNANGAWHVIDPTPAPEESSGTGEGGYY